jgi:NADH-quinone oxidoreductase subunit G
MTTARGVDELVNLTVDGTAVRVPKGTLVIEAAKQAGVLVPHYCYHPGLPVAGVCRMCLVEIEKAPKLQIACSTQVAEGMVVHTQSAQAKSARTGVLELLLINHPLDCPICDQAGECELQDFTFQEGRPASRFSPTYAKRFNPVEDFGPDVLYVPNRCILCTRCVRFMEDVAREPVLNVSERGDRAYIGVHPEARLDHPWSGNVVDLCPVGSLLSKDFLHKARAWELDKAASICTGCSQGCNVTLDTRDNTVVRIRPRPNLAVNRYFMCDHGRAQYRWLNRGDRIEAPLVRQPDGEHRAVDWDEACERVASLLRGAGGSAVALVSPRASTEALFLARALLANFEWTGAFQLVMGDVAPLAGVPNLALRAERAPNVTGAELLGYTRAYAPALAAAERAGVVLVLDDPEVAVRPAGSLIYLGTVLPDDGGAALRSADVVLPIANVAEEDGTFVNRDGRVQRYCQAKAAPGMAQPAWWVLGELLARLERGSRVTSAAEAFDRLAREVEGLQGLSYATLGWEGQRVSGVVEVPA